MELIWNSLNVKPQEDGFYLAVLKVVGTDKKYFDIVAFKDDKWKFNMAGKLYPIDIDDLNHDWTGCSCKPLYWSELPDIESI